MIPLAAIYSQGRTAVNTYAIRACADDSLLGYCTTDELPSHGWFWACSGGVWVKAYVAEITSDTPGSWSFLEQCGVTPTGCTDLVGWPASDDFSGDGCNSGAVDDVNWGFRFTELSKTANSTSAITGGNLVLTSLGTASFESVVYALNAPSVSGDFTYAINVSSAALPALATNNGTGFGIQCTADGSNRAVGFIFDGDGDAQIDAAYLNDAETDWVGSGPVTPTGIIEISRVGSSMDLKVGGSTLQTWTHSGVVSGFAIFFYRNSNDGLTTTATISDLSLVDGSDDPIIAYDPTGEACP